VFGAAWYEPFVPPATMLCAADILPSFSRQYCCG
jgi:hypothetical protein